MFWLCRAHIRLLGFEAEVGLAEGIQWTMPKCVAVPDLP